MTWWQGLVLGIVQGLTEFLPVSSSGHLVIAEAAIGLRTPGVLVEVALHVATLLAVVVVYRERLVELTLQAFAGAGSAWKFISLLAIATVPAAAMGFFFKEWFERTFESLAAVGFNLILTALILWTSRKVARGSKSEPTALGAVAIGFAQALALLPGISRSGSTVAAGLWLKLDPVKAAEFSFLMSIPAILGAATLQIAGGSADAALVGTGPMAVSFLAALVAGVFAIRVLVALLQRGQFHRFAPYCLAAGVVTLVWSVLRS